MNDGDVALLANLGNPEHSGFMEDVWCHDPFGHAPTSLKLLEHNQRVSPECLPFECSPDMMTEVVVCHAYHPASGEMLGP